MKNKKTYQPTNEILKGGDTAFDYIEPVQAKPLEVKVYNNFDKAMKAFRALVQKERTVSTYKEKQRFEKPSDKKRRKRNERKRKLLELQGSDDYLIKKQKKAKPSKVRGPERPSEQEKL